MVNILLVYFMLQFVLIFFVILTLDDFLYYMLLKPYIQLTGITSYSYANLYDLLFFNYIFCIYYFFISVIPICIYIFKVIYSNSFPYKFIIMFNVIYHRLFNFIYISLFVVSFFFIFYIYLIFLYENQIFDNNTKYFLAYELFFTKYTDFWFACGLLFNSIFLTYIDDLFMLTFNKCCTDFYYDNVVDFLISFCFTTIVIPPFLDIQLLFCFYFSCCYFFINCFFETYKNYYFNFLK